MVWAETFITSNFSLKTKFKDCADPLTNDIIWMWYERDCGNMNVKMYGRDKSAMTLTQNLDTWLNVTANPLPRMHQLVNKMIVRYLIKNCC